MNICAKLFPGVTGELILLLLQSNKLHTPGRAHLSQSKNHL
uniref:Uncharacterized protein n=1 Tax=Anguilla anguilla TaxID=7936 RepID=A0A0E9QET7_ANGAN